MSNDITEKARALLLAYEGHNPVSFLQRQLGVSWNRAAEIYEALNGNKEALRDAVRYLRRLQDWRTGKDVRTQKDAGINPSALTEAIDTILEYFGLPEPITNCEGCKFNGEDQGFAGCVKIGSFGDQCCKFEPKEAETNSELELRYDRLWRRWKSLNEWIRALLALGTSGLENITGGKAGEE